MQSLGSSVPNWQKTGLKIAGEAQPKMCLKPCHRFGPYQMITHHPSKSLAIYLPFLHKYPSSPREHPRSDLKILHFRLTFTSDSEGAILPCGSTGQDIYFKVFQLLSVMPLFSYDFWRTPRLAFMHMVASSHGKRGKEDIRR